MTIKPLTIHPIIFLTKYNDFMTKCLSAGNLEIHYVKSFQEYFEKNNSVIGFHHQQTSVDGCT